MKQVEWNQAWEIGIPEIDVQHRRLVALINEVLSAFEQYRDNNPKKYVIPFINKLLTNIESHFTNEENLMQTLGCSELQEHKSTHAALLLEMQDYQSLINKNMLKVDEKFILILKNWLLDHMAEDAADMVDCLGNYQAIQSGGAV